MLNICNAVVCLPRSTRVWLEHCQSEVGRVALGCHGLVAKVAIQGDIGWSLFEARKAQSEIAYEGRLGRMTDTRWAQYIHFTGIRTKWCTRLHVLPRKFSFFAHVQPQPQQKDRRCLEFCKNLKAKASWSFLLTCC